MNPPATLDPALIDGRSAIAWWRTSFGDAEVNRLREAIANEHVGQGPLTAQFEVALAQALGAPYAVATTSGSVALLMALMALGVGRDDEVIVPNRCWISPAHAALLLGAKVVLVDVRPDVPNMDVSQVERKITRRTKAIVPVHLNGRAVDMAALRTIAKEHGVGIVEDAAQALFSKNQFGFLGAQSEAGCFSFSPAKLVSTGQGGLVVTSNKAIYERLRRIRTHGVADLIEVTYTQVGFNFKFSDLSAAVGFAQLARAKARIAQLNAIYTCYAAAMEELPFLKLVPVDVAGGEVPLYVEVLCEERDRLRAFLRARKIHTRPFYPDLDRAPYLHTDEVFPRSRRFSEQGLFLPCGPEQVEENIERVIEALKEYRAHA